MKHNKVSFFKKQPVQYFNLEKVNDTYNGLILLTGLVGSGKTSSAEAFARRFNAIPVSFDVLKFYETSSLISQKIFNEFSHLYPEIKNLVAAQWRDCNNKDEDKLYAEYCHLFFQFLQRKAKKENLIYLIEGIQIFARLCFTEIITYPCIILMTPSVICMRNFKKREKKLNINHHLLELQKKYLLYHFRQRKLLNQLIVEFQNYYQNLQSK